MSTEIFYPIKRIVRRNTKGVKRPFLIEWLTKEPSEKTWEPWYNLSETLQKQYYKNGKKKKRAKETIIPAKPRCKPKCKRKLDLPHNLENHAIIPAKRQKGVKEYSEYLDSTTGETILVVKTYDGVKVEYQMFQRISHAINS